MLQLLRQTHGARDASATQVAHEEARVADPIPVGSDVSAGTFECTNCGYELGVQSVQSLPALSELRSPLRVDRAHSRQCGSWPVSERI